MIPIYFINLASRPERREFMERQFSSLGLQAKRVEGRTPADVDAAALQAYCNPAKMRWIMPPELACNLSHLAAWKMFLSDGAETAAFFEDDILISRSMPAFLEACRGPIEEDVIRLETLGRIRNRVRMLPAERQVLPGIGLFRTLIHDSGSSGYILTRRSADMLVQREEMMSELVDSVLFSPFSPLGEKLVVRQAVPALCIQLTWAGKDVPEAPSGLEKSRSERRLERKGQRFTKQARARVNGWLTYDLRKARGRIREFLMKGVHYRPIPFLDDSP